MATSIEKKRAVREAFRPWESGNSTRFFEIIADDVLWTVIGTTWASGAYRSKKELVDKAFGPLLGQLDGSLTTRFVDLAAGDKDFLRF